MNIEIISDCNYRLIDLFMKELILIEDIEFTSIQGLNTMISFYSKEQMIARSQNENTLFLQIQENSEFIGFGELDKNHLVSLFLKKENRNKKIGRFFLDYIISKNYVNDEITVFSSPISIKFYTNYGFIQQSVNCKIIKGMLYVPMVKHLKQTK